MDPLFYSIDIFLFIKKGKYNVVSINDIALYLKTGFAAGKNDQELETDGIIQLRPTNMNEQGLLIFDKNIELPKELLNLKKDDLLQKDEILFNNTNSQELVGKSAFFNLDGNYFCSNHVTRIKVKKESINPKYLWILLNLYQKQKVFFNLCTNWNNQSGVNIELLKTIQIPLPPLDIQQKIVSIMDNAYKTKKDKEIEAESLLNSIDDYVLDELGIKIPEITKKMCFKVNLEDIRGGRIDNEYHQPKFRYYFENIKKSKYSIENLNKIVEFIENGRTPPKECYIDNKKGLPIIKVAGASKKIIDLNKLEYFKKDFKPSKSVKKGDIFILAAAHQADYIGKNISILDDEPKENIYYVGELINIRTNKECNNYYLYSFLSTNFMFHLINREKRGQTSHLYPDDLKTLPIPIPPLDIQQKIANEVKNRMDTAKNLKKEAKEGLEKAKREIEKIIFEE